MSDETVACKECGEPVATGETLCAACWFDFTDVREEWRYWQRYEDAT